MTERKYTKADMITTVAHRTSIEREDVQMIIECFLDTIRATLMEAATIELRGFGTFEFKRRKGREKARNPRTGEILSVQAHGVVTFRPGRTLKQDLWNLGGETDRPDVGEANEDTEAPDGHAQ
ncbi:MAG: integration host factor subunit beta [Treponema sp.]|jgi:integration host factor subunit beta|nr:integration host factor subunit beta [Treponema sp.]